MVQHAVSVGCCQCTSLEVSNARCVRMGRMQVMSIHTSWSVKQFASVAFQLFVCRNAILLLFAGASFPITGHLSFL